MIVSLTQAGIDALEASTGLINLSTFQLGTGVNYIPEVTDTALHGATVFSGEPTGPVAENGNIVKYAMFLDFPVGPFQFGEFGLYMDNGELFALGAGSELISKIQLTSGQTGNAIKLVAFLSMVGDNYEMWLQLAETNNQFRVAILQSPDLLPPSQTAQPNMYVVQGASTAQSAFLAFTDKNGLWNFDAYAFANTFEGTVVAATNQSVTIDFSEYNVDMQPSYFGEIILQFSTGSLYSICRYVDTVVVFGGVVTISLSAPLAIVPVVNDKFLLFTRQALSTSNVILPIASETVLGGIKVGEDFTIDPDGTLNLNTASPNLVTSVNDMTGDVELTANDIPGFALVATTGNYNDLIGAPGPYNLPTMSQAVTGGAKLPANGNLIVDSNGALDLGIAPVLTVRNQAPDGSGNVALTIPGLVDPTLVPITDDLNSYIVPKLYYTVANNANGNIPFGDNDAGVLEVTTLSPPAVMQRYTTVSAVYFRFFDGSAWSVWNQLATPTSGLPIATSTELGVIMVGPTLTIAPNGQLDVFPIPPLDTIWYAGDWDMVTDEIAVTNASDFFPQRLADGGMIEWEDEANPGVWIPVDASGRVYFIEVGGTTTVDGLGELVPGDKLISINGLWQKFGGGEPLPPEVIEITGNSILDGDDVGNILRSTLGTPVVITLPMDPVDIEIGDKITLRQQGAGSLTFALANPAIVLNLPYGGVSPVTPGIGAQVTLTYVDDNVWDMTGDIRDF